MVSKMILDRQKRYEDVESWVAAHADTIAEQLNKILGNPSSSEEMIQAITRVLRGACKRLLAADEAHAVELSNDQTPRLARDGSAEAVTVELQHARSAIEPVYGAAGLKVVGLDEKIPRDPAALSRMAHLFVRSTSEEGFKMPPRKMAGVNVDLSVFVAEVSRVLPKLDAALKQVIAAEGEAQATQKVKNDAVEAFDSTFSSTTAALYAFAVLVGSRDVGDKLPSLPRAKPAAARPPVATPPPA